MGEKLNHHFVPKFYFRLFNGGRNYIFLFNIAAGRQIPGSASIKGQCARHRYYGSTVFEDALCVLETAHREVLKKLLSLIWGDSGRVPWTGEDDYRLREAVLLQRVRTPRAIDILSGSYKQFMLHLLQERLEKSPRLTGHERKQIKSILGSGELNTDKLDKQTLRKGITLALKSVLGIADLSVIVIRNRTEAPFVPFFFADAPVAFYNKYLYHIPNFGALGWLSPGLMISLPLNPVTSLILFDREVYRMSGNSGPILDISKQSDISALNSLQLYSTRENLYFVEPEHGETVRLLFEHHRERLKQSCGAFEVIPPERFSINGKPGEVAHLFEPQLPVSIDLSFLSTKAFDQRDLARPRSLIIAKALESIQKSSSGTVPVEDLLSNLIDMMTENKHAP